jgi:hypothetical protein
MVSFCAVIYASELLDEFSNVLLQVICPLVSLFLRRESWAQELLEELPVSVKQNSNVVFR